MYNIYTKSFTLLQYVNQRLQIQLELLMMSGMPLETCWAFNERWNNKFYCKVASCWLFLLNFQIIASSGMTFFCFVTFSTSSPPPSISGRLQCGLPSVDYVIHLGLLCRPFVLRVHTAATYYFPLFPDWCYCHFSSDYFTSYS